MASRRERTSSTIGPKQYSFEELAAATGRFSRKNLLGEGGYGEVFKGFLDEHRAIKKLRIISSDEQRKKELEHEIKVINSVSHRNLVKLVGYCIEENDVLLVLEKKREDFGLARKNANRQRLSKRIGIFA
ncbi:L-type lectin-domain containing receptor kinase IX.2-like [Manihot esculenta]|uniref:L-type lectin-domain containing receptor kinase IX.2-like n=1 Tax=Manihot esculenta TaxID=3983 RepID=UPI001CC6758A|nr:L-type lectin-domain containing receptor kinase IX.2-like [Manihot esculenta]